MSLVWFKFSLVELPELELKDQINAWMASINATQREREESQKKKKRQQSSKDGRKEQK